MKAPSGAQWIHEIKYDGYRVQLRIDGDDRRAFTRNGYDWISRFSRIAGAFDVEGQAIVDGEVVVIHEGRTNFSELQADLGRGDQDRLLYFAFDLLWLDGGDPRKKARSLGMNRLRSFFAATLPQIRSSVVAGGIFASISAMDETIVALFTAGGQYQPLTKRMFTALRDEIDSTIAAISTPTTAASFALVLLATGRRRGNA